MWITWLVIILAVAMVIGPVMMVRPTPGMNRLANLRTMAGQKGLSIRLEPNFNEKGALYILPHTPSIRRHLLAKQWSLIRHNHEHDIHFHGVWHWSNESSVDEYAQSQLKSALDELPQYVTMVSCEPGGLGVFWDELCRGRSEDQAITDVNEWLLNLQGSLEPR